MVSPNQRKNTHKEDEVEQEQEVLGCCDAAFPHGVRPANSRQEQVSLFCTRARHGGQRPACQQVATDVTDGGLAGLAGHDPDWGGGLKSTRITQTKPGQSQHGGGGNLYSHFIALTSRSIHSCV